MKTHPLTKAINNLLIPEEWDKKPIKIVPPRLHGGLKPQPLKRKQLMEVLCPICDVVLKEYHCKHCKMVFKAENLEPSQDWKDRQDQISESL